MNYVVYKHTDINNKVYIGITKQNILARWKNGYKNNFAFNKETEKNVFREKIGKRVKCIETGIVYLSARLAGQKNNIGCNHITEVCNGKRKTVGGYHWQYV